MTFQQPNIFSSTGAQKAPAARPSQTSFTPTFDSLENAHEYILEGEFPGLHNKEMVIEFTDAQTISIRGKIERREENVRIIENVGEEHNKVWTAERKVGEFQRGFTFHEGIDIEAVKATLEYGVLRIVVPKIVPPWPRRIQIQ